MLMTDPKRAKHFLAMALIGDGIMALINPQRDAHAWRVGPKPWKDLMHKLHENPALTRAIGVAQIAAGVMWVMHEEKAEKKLISD